MASPAWLVSTVSAAGYKAFAAKILRGKEKCCQRTENHHSNQAWNIKLQKDKKNQEISDSVFVLAAATRLVGFQPSNLDQ